MSLHGTELPPPHDQYIGRKVDVLSANIVDPGWLTGNITGIEPVTGWIIVQVGQKTLTLPPAMENFIFLG